MAVLGVKLKSSARKARRHVILRIPNIILSQTQQRTQHDPWFIDLPHELRASHQLEVETQIVVD
jgi:hypothetical protein